MVLVSEKKNRHRPLDSFNGSTLLKSLKAQA